MATSCCNKTIKLNITNSMETVPVNKVQLTNEFYVWFKGVQDRVGIAQRYSTSECVQIVNYHNQFYNTNLSEHNIVDLKQCLMNMKALYHQIRRGEIIYEQEESQSEAIEKLDEEIILDNEKEIIKEIEIEHENTIVDEAIEETETYVDKDTETYSDGTPMRYCKNCGASLSKKIKSDLCKVCQFKLSR